MVGLSIYGLVKGDIWKVIGGIAYDDSTYEGMICGADAAVKDAKYLYLSDIRLDSANADSVKQVFMTGVCVSECPTANSPLKCAASEQANCDSLSSESRYDTIQIGPYCFPKSLDDLNPT